MCSKEREINDEAHLLSIFPAEIWLLVFNKITNADNQEGLCNSSTFFRNLFLNERTQFMFTNVWKILGKKYEENIGTPGSAYHDNTTPSKNMLLNLVNRIRLVCLSWNNAISNYYQNHPMHYELRQCATQSSGEMLTASMLQRNTFAQKKPEITDQFLSHFSQTDDNENRNPFFGKGAAFEFFPVNTENEDELANKIVCLVSKFGHHMWYCAVSFFCASCNDVDYYSRIREVLELMPNLKVLRLNLDAPVFSDCDSMTNTRRLLPALRDLRVLSTYNVPTPIIDRLIRQNTNITTLRIAHSHKNEELNFNAMSVLKLKTLYIAIYTESEFERLSNSQVKWPLGKLCIDFSQCDFVHWQRIFSALEEKWSDSLTDLEVMLPEAKELEHRVNIFQNGAVLKLNLPQLKSLKMYLRNLVSLDCLLTLRNCLLNLQIRIFVTSEKIKQLVDVETLEKGNVIKLLSCSSHPLESNIWKLFPKLEWVHLDQYIAFGGPHCDCACKFRLHDKWSHSRRDWKGQINQNYPGDKLY